MPHILWVLTALSHWTVIHRIYHTWRELRENDRAAVEAARVKRENTQTSEKQTISDLGSGYPLAGRAE
jgi:hypothetical protein